MTAFLLHVKTILERIVLTVLLLFTGFSLLFILVMNLILPEQDPPTAGQDRAPPNSEKVHAEEFGDAWPFTTRMGHLVCEKRYTILFRTERNTYALNGIAAGWYPHVHPIWRDDPSLPGTKVSVAPLIERAQKLCDASR